MKQYLLKLIDGATLTQEETHSIMLLWLSSHAE